MRLIFEVTVELERDEGKFIGKDEAATQITEWLEQANEDTLTGENDGQYSVIEWEVKRTDG